MYVARLFALSLVASCSGTALDARAATDASLDAASTSPIEGDWQVTSMRCGGERASDGATAFFTAPNSSAFSVRGTRSTYTLTTATCVVTLRSTVTWPSSGRAIFTADGPFACAPAGCAATCGTTPSIPYVYQYERRGAGLVMTTVGETPDQSCTGFGQSNPIEYTYAPR